MFIYKINGTTGNNPCNARLLDTGGMGANYGPNENITMSFSASDPAGPVVQINIKIVDFDLEDSNFGADHLEIYNSSSTCGAPVFDMAGMVAQGTNFSISGSDVTFRFES